MVYALALCLFGIGSEYETCLTLSARPKISPGTPRASRKRRRRRRSRSGTSDGPNVQIAGVRITSQRLLNLQRQAVHAAAHVGPADRQPYPHPARNRDHRRSKAAITAAARSGEIDAGIRTREEPDSSISIAGATAASTTAGRVASTARQ